MACHEKVAGTCHAESSEESGVGHTARLVRPDASLPLSMTRRGRFLMACHKRSARGWLHGMDGLAAVCGGRSRFSPRETQGPLSGVGDRAAVPDRLLVAGGCAAVKHRWLYPDNWDELAWECKNGRAGVASIAALRTGPRRSPSAQGSSIGSGWRRRISITTPGTRTRA